MSGFFDAPPIPREEWTSLVAQGQNRVKVLDEIVAAWCTSFHEEDIDKHIAAGGLVIAGKVFVDANNDEPIDLGDLLRRVEQRLRDSGAPESFKQRPDLHILLRDCHLPRVSAAGLLIRPRFSTLRTRFEYVNLSGARFGDRASFASAEFGNWASYASTAFGDEASFDSAAFGDEASFDSAAFGDEASFASATFGNWARFDSATFGYGARFASAKFGDRASFDSATFGYGASFASAKFGYTAELRCATFGDEPSFESAKFASFASFDVAKFGDRASFALAKFGHGASFVRTRFGNRAAFYSATFGHGALFDSATFGDLAFFDSAIFGDGAHFEGSSFRDHPILVNCQFGPYGGIGGALATLPAPTWFSRFGRSLAAPWRWYGWRKVRAVGELQLLTRVSYIALFVVPILAGMWPAVRAGVNWVNDEVRRAAAVFHDSAQRLESAARHANPATPSQPADAPVTPQSSEVRKRIEEGLEIVRRIDAQLGEKSIQTPELPPTWVWGFFAALSVTLGHLAYQVWADERVRRQSIDDFARERNREFRECTEDQRRDLLARALPWIRQIAERLPAARHPNLVRRHGQTVWVPSSLDDLLHVRSRDKEAVPATTADEGDAPDASTAATEPGTPSASEANETARPGAEGRRGDVSRPALWREELELVIIDEGARAEYDLAARERMFPASVSGLLYAVGVGLILWIIYLQSVSILRQGAVIEG